MRALTKLGRELRYGGHVNGGGAEFEVMDAAKDLGVLAVVHRDFVLGSSCSIPPLWQVERGVPGRQFRDVRRVVVPGGRGRDVALGAGQLPAPSRLCGSCLFYFVDSFSFSFSFSSDLGASLTTFRWYTNLGGSSLPCTVILSHMVHWHTSTAVPSPDECWFRSKREAPCFSVIHQFFRLSQSAVKIVAGSPSLAPG